MNNKYRIIKKIVINVLEEPRYAIYDVIKNPWQWQEVSNPIGFKTEAEAKEYLGTLLT